MKLNKSLILALGAAVLIVVWFLVKTSLHVRNEANAAQNQTQNLAQDQENDETQKETRPAVVISESQSEPHTNIFTLYGRSEPNREVVVKAKTAGPVVATPAKEGGRIKRGGLLCRQDVDARQARLEQAEAMLRSNEFDMKSTQTLVDKGYKSEIQLANTQATLDGTRASVKQAKIELDNINIRAPFSGIFEDRMAEIGDYLAPGTPCGLIVEMSPLVVAVQLTETQLADITVGDTAEIVLATGQTVSGKVRVIEGKANPSTRTFGAKLTVPNADYALKAGVTATVRLRSGVEKAHHIPAKILSINAAGRLGIRYVDTNMRVQFAAVTTIDEDQSGLWVTGLPDIAHIIIEGQDFVAVGTQVDAQRSEGRF